MWQYQNTDELYHYGIKGMRWEHRKESHEFKDGTNQHYTSYTDKNGNNVTLVKGRNKDNKYAGISIGKIKDVDKYREKSLKIGKHTLNVNNENGQLNVTLHKDSKIKRKTKGKKLIEKHFSKNTKGD